MKFRITYKSPDSVYDGIKEAINQSFDSIIGTKEEEIRDVMWTYGEEYLIVEFDTDTNVAPVVIKRR